PYAQGQEDSDGGADPETTADQAGPPPQPQRPVPAGGGRRRPGRPAAADCRTALSPARAGSAGPPAAPGGRGPRPAGPGAVCRRTPYPHVRLLRLSAPPRPAVYRVADRPARPRPGSRGPDRPGRPGAGALPGAAAGVADAHGRAEPGAGQHGAAMGT